MTDVPCVGFADCPCRRCRLARLEAHNAHPNHTPGQAAYCGACQRIARERKNRT